MGRIKFRQGGQRNFISNVMSEIGCPSLNELSRRLDMSYSTLKNYFTEVRMLPEVIFKDLCQVSKIVPNSLSVEVLGENWGQVKGGKKSQK